MNFLLRRITSCLPVAALMLFCVAAQAMNCIALAKPQFVFGLYEPMSNAPHDIEAQFLLYCQPAIKGETLTLRIGLAEAASSAGIRNLQGAQYGDLLQFGIYRDPARSLIVSEESGINVYESLLADKLISIPLYGRIYARQNISADSYQAGIIVTLDY